MALSRGRTNRGERGIALGPCLRAPPDDSDPIAAFVARHLIQARGGEGVGGHVGGAAGPFAQPHAAVIPHQDVHRQVCGQGGEPAEVFLDMVATPLEVEDGGFGLSVLEEHAAQRRAVLTLELNGADLPGQGQVLQLGGPVLGRAGG